MWGRRVVVCRGEEGGGVWGEESGGVWCGGERRMALCSVV